MVTESDGAGIGETRPFKVLSPGTMISHYKIIEKIGEGGMGVVYKATDTKLGRTVALKFLPPRLLCDAEAKSRFEHEAKAASALNHPNIATIYEIEEVEGRCFMAMEYLEGGSLKGLLKTRDLSIKEVLGLALQIGEGLNAAHERGVVHRDIKPDNIMLAGKGLVKIMDFGLAKLKGVSRVTKAGTTVGTLQYMSPEQAQGKEVDRRSDLFSFGVILYEMIAGRRPFAGDTEAAVINSIINDTPEPMARYKVDVPEGLQRIVDRALAKDAGERYQHADDVVAELGHEKRLLETGMSTVTQVQEARPSSRSRLLRIVIPAGIAVVAALLLFVFEPFRVEMGPGEEASAQENSLAIMYFENMVDPEDTDRTAQMITTLLMTDLSESDYMYVISRQRLYDILKLLGKEDLKVIDRTVASEVAGKAGVKWILTGSILQIEPNMVLTSDISDASTGRILSTQRITSQPDEDLFAVVDRLSAAVKQDLALPSEARTEPDQPVARVTTSSPEAYRHYVEGIEYDLKFFVPEAIESFEKAVDYDSTFAMAHLELSLLQWGAEQSQQHLAWAVRYIDRASEREQYLIRSWEASFAGAPAQAAEILREAIDKYPDDKRLLFDLGVIYRSDMKRPTEAIEVFTRATEVDPLYVDAYNALAYMYDQIGDFDKSIRAIDKYVSIAPDEPNPYDTRGDLYAYAGRIDDARSSYEQAVRNEPGFLISVTKLGHMSMYEGRYEDAKRYYSRLASSPHGETRSQGRFWLAVIPAYQGRLDEALRTLTDGLTADRLDQYEGIFSAEKYRLKAELHAMRGEYDMAIAAAEQSCHDVRASHPTALALYRLYQIFTLAECKRFEEAERRAEAYRVDLKAGDSWGLKWYWISRAFIDVERGASDVAVLHVGKASEIEPIVYFIARATLARGYMGSDNLAGAVAELERALQRYDWDRMTLPTHSVRAHYLLGQAYEQSGWTNKAIEQYEEFLEIWKDADPGIPRVEDARRRLAVLKPSP
jgi:serine/threonine protein kinase/tetratricopeptide (TPR) repeat protein